MIGTDCTGSCKSNYHTITNMTAPLSWTENFAHNRQVFGFDSISYIVAIVLCSDYTIFWFIQGLV